MSFIFIFSFINVYEPLKLRIINSTLSQIKSSSFFLIPSYRHELHYSNAIYIFQDNLFFGKGIKSFRYICKNYDAKIQKKIIDDKSVYAPENGYSFLISNDIERKIIFIEKKITKYDFENNFNYKNYYVDINGYLVKQHIHF